MRFTISSSELNAKLQSLHKVINSKNSLQILDSFLFQVNNGKLTLTASDSENTMKSSLDLQESEGNGEFAVSNRNILEAVKELPEQPLFFNVDLSNLNIQITYQNGLYNFSAQNADIYPKNQSIEDGANTIRIKAETLNNNISRCLFATAQDELRPVMGGLYFDLSLDNLAIVASDGHKLVRNRINTIKSEELAAFILPKKPASLLKNILPKDDTDVLIKFNERNAQISFNETELSCRLIEGRYPNYNSVIPNNNPNKLTIDRRALLGALKRVIPFASESSQLVRFYINKNQLELSSEDIDFATSAKETLICEYEEIPMSIGFKGSSMTEILNNLECDEVTIELADPGRAGVIIPTIQSEESEVLMLIMPMLLND